MDVFCPRCYSPCTPTTAPLKTPRSSLTSSRTVTRLPTDRRLKSWLSGAVLTTWSSTRSKQWRWSWTSGEPPRPLSSHSPSWTALWQQWRLRQLRKINLPQELLIQFYSAIIESVLCTSITVWFSSATKSDLRRLRRVVWTAERIIGTTLRTLQELYSSRVSKRADKITLNPSHQHTPSVNGYRLVDATELWAPERPDTGTVSSLRQSISWTLDNNVEHTTLLHNYLFTTHSYFSFQICKSDRFSHTIVCVVFCVFAILYIAYLYIVLL